MRSAKKKPPVPLTPDKRYIMVRGRLWRSSNPELPEDRRQSLVNDLQDGRRAVKAAHGEPAALKRARLMVDKAKHGLGERGPPWWTDGARDFNRCLARNTPYAMWAEELDDAC